ncbi:hypothetical protein ACFWXO_12260 [Kitasatospora sp. NPDC059088]|uniref:hypothetical protein n=1 Tax=Kitasatospora sp. NPDC059088 TaxID=3346722 RepID=UPI0036B84204
MTSFHTHRALVLDAALPVRRRHSALRTCLTGFAPYGLRATYHHLTLSARMPRHLEADPESLVRAVEELHEARQLWLARAEQYAAQRRTEKRDGRRAATPVWWNQPWWTSPNDAWRHDPFLHPALRLPDYVRRQNALLDGAELPGCPACGEEGPAVEVSTGHDRAELCRTCARVLVPCPCGRWHSFQQELRVGWGRTWRREHMTGGGEPNPYWPAHLGAARVRRLMGYVVLHLPG